MRATRKAEKTIPVYTVVWYSDTSPGPIGDGVIITRFSYKSEAETFAKGRRLYGQPAKVTAEDTPKHIANRWGIY